MEKLNNNLTHLIDVKEISRAYGITKSAIFNLVKNGKFPEGYKIGGSRRWNPAEVENWVKKQSKEAISC